MVFDINISQHGGIRNAVHWKELTKQFVMEKKCRMELKSLDCEPKTPFVMFLVGTIHTVTPLKWWRIEIDPH